MPDRFDIDRTEKIKDAFLVGSSAGAAPGASPELLRSWRRSQQALGAPANIVDVPHVSEELLDEHLLNMFRAPLTTFSDSLFGTRLGVLLADSRGLILHRWCGDRSATAHLDRIGTTRGAVLAEDAVGTNGVGTVAAAGRSVQIQGTEHFARFYSDAVCTGAPVRHPMTGKLLAVVTLSCELTPRADLLKPLLGSVIQKLEQHVLEVEQPAARRMFSTFLDVSRTQPDPVVAFGPQGLLIQSPQAGRLLPDDLERIRLASADDQPGDRQVLELSSGQVGIKVLAAEADNRVVVVLEQEQSSHAQRRHTLSAPRPAPPLVGRSAEWLSVAETVARHRGAAEPLVVAGECGSGKLSLALGRPFRAEGAGKPGDVYDAAERHLVGTRAWLRGLAERIAGHGPLVVRGVETLDQPTLDGIRAVLERTTARAPVMFTLSTGSREDAEAFGLKYQARTVWVPALRERPADIPALWRYFANLLAPNVSLAPRADTMDLLREYRWPGNLTELRTVVGQLIAAGRTGPVPPEALPPVMQGVKSLTMIERVEIDAIRRALEEANGNRTKAAEILGISRATVYRKMKAYHLGG